MPQHPGKQPGGGTATHQPQNVRPHGDAVQPEDAGVPRPRASDAEVQQGGPPPQQGAGPLPGGLEPLDAPTERPGEPITEGLDDPHANQLLPHDPDLMLRAMYREFPHEDIRSLIEKRRRGVI